MTFGDLDYYKRQYFLARARADAGVAVDTAGIAAKLATIMQAAVILNEEFEFANARALAAEAKLTNIREWLAGSPLQCVCTEIQDILDEEPS